MSILQLQQAICFMEEHILEDITYADAAKSVHMSAYSFHRVFSFTVGIRRTNIFETGGSAWLPRSCKQRGFLFWKQP